MTGAYVRVQRNGEWQNLEIDELTDQELTTFLKEQTPDRVIVWAVFLAGWIRDNVKEGE